MSRSQPSEGKRFYLNEQLRRLIALARRILPEAIELVLNPTGSEILVESDAFQLDQILLNFLINSSDAMPQGGCVTITVECKAFSVAQLAEHFTTNSPAQPGLYAQIRVSGTGLGLAVSHESAPQHAGYLRCESELGVGRCFFLVLPMVSSVESALPVRGGGSVEPCKIAPEGRRCVPGGRERILVADDEPLLRRVAIRMLRRAGYHAEAVSTGAEACDATASCHWDALIMDVVMPGMACGEAVRTIQRLRPAMPILLTSGYTGGADLQELTRRTGLPLLCKPYAPHQVLQELRDALDERQRPMEWSPRFVSSSSKRVSGAAVQGGGAGLPR